MTPNTPTKPMRSHLQAADVELEIASRYFLEIEKCLAEALTMVESTDRVDVAQVLEETRLSLEITHSHLMATRMLISKP